MKTKLKIRSLDGLIDYDSTKRNATADLLKGLAIIFMIQVHVTEFLAKQELFDSIWGAVSLFFGGPPAAPVFMAVMGYFLAGSKKDFETSLLRGIYLFLGGILLNIGLNFNLLVRIYRGEYFLDPFRYVFGVDILLLAGMSIILLTLIKKLVNIHFLIPLFLSLLLTFLSDLIPVFPEFQSPVLRYLIPVFGGNQDWSYFPVIPWLAYPLLGWSFRMLQNKYKNHIKADNQITILVLLAWGLFLYITGQYAILVAANLPVYYHHGIVFFIWVIFFLSGYLFFFYKVNSIFPKSNILLYIKWLGQNVTLVYVFQWLIIGNISTEIYKTQTLLNSVLWFFAVMTAVTVLTVLANKLIKKAPGD